jgi:hypothetical protein
VQRRSYPTLSVTILGAVGRTVNIECLGTTRWTVNVLMVPDNPKVLKSIKNKLLEIYANNTESNARGGTI